MNKQLLLETLLNELNRVHQTAVGAVIRAHETATDDANIAENKYDTLALEAGYLAHGQSLRVAQCYEDIQSFKALSLTSTFDKVSVGALIALMEDNQQQKWFFFGPSAGGLKVVVDNVEIVVVTTNSPLGKAIISKKLNDEVIVNIAKKVSEYLIIELY